MGKGYEEELPWEPALHYLPWHQTEENLVMCLDDDVSLSSFQI